MDNDISIIIRRGKMYTLNILGDGRITLALLKRIIDFGLDKKIKKIVVWKRNKYIYEQGSIIEKTDTMSEDIIGIHTLNALGVDRYNEIRKKIIFCRYSSIEELQQIDLCNKECILLILTKYKLKELFYISDDEKYNFNNDVHVELFKKRYGLFFSMLDKKNYDNKRWYLEYCRLKEKYAIYDARLDYLNSEIAVGSDRLYNLKDSTLCINSLANVLKKDIRINGLIINMVNEVDATNYILYKRMKLDVTHIISPCENDNYRANYFMRKHLEDEELTDFKLNVLGPHNYLCFISSDIIDEKWNDDKKKQYKLLLEKVHKEVSEFGEKIFEKKRSSDEDTVDGLYDALQAVICNLKDKVFRASYYSKKYEHFTGIPVRFVDSKFLPVESMMDFTSENVKEKFDKGLKSQIIIDDVLDAILKKEKTAV